MDKINVFDTPQAEHIKYVEKLEHEALAAYRYVMKFVIKDIIKAFKKEKLTKSDDLPKGWRGNKNRLEIDIEEKVAPILKKYCKAFNWLMFGDYAGKEAKDIAKGLKLHKIATPGSALAAYLHTIDANSEYYRKVMEKDINFPKSLMKESMSAIPQMSQPTLKYFYEQLTHNIIVALQNYVNDFNTKKDNQFFKEVHELDNKTLKDVKKIGKNLDDYIKTTSLEIELRKEIRRQERGYALATQATITKASATGTHQSMYEIYGRSDDDVSVIWVTLEDKSVCSFCAPLSKDKNGDYIKYKLADFKPAGYNIGRKRADWKMCIPAIHPNCRCNIIYLAKGWAYAGDELVRIKD